MRRRPPRSTRTDTLFPYTTLFRSQVMAGGNDSSANAIANAMLRLVEHPELQERLRAQPELVPQFVEETLRLRSEEHTSELQSLMRISYAVFCLKTKRTLTHNPVKHTTK